VPPECCQRFLIHAAARKTRARCPRHEGCRLDECGGKVAGIWLFLYFCDIGLEAVEFEFFLPFEASFFVGG
jgi:hypothetical protein